MAEKSGDEGLVQGAVLKVAGKATLPFQAARADRSFGTAFWYNDLVESAADREVVRQYLVTAERRTRYEIGQFTLREGLAEPELPADELVLPGFAKKWRPLGNLGVAAMPTTDLHIHAERKGWSWATHEVTAGLAARPDDIALLGDEPLPAYALGHEVVDAPDSAVPDRPQALVAGAVTRPDPELLARWAGPVPAGFDGAPVFAALPTGEEQVKLVCLGLLLAAVDEPSADGPGGPEVPGAPGSGPGGSVVTFDLLRPGIHALTPARGRHWWQRG
ncbi:hypothetical protein [Actinacidiphila sp. ITFR-21]|uniref:hypothetical protein n=1 Tax=Actinacidiphila sp. ITFR-21 TaxID=3075199 RepID=UPI002889A920|nr:hypothetical protein [Streptomyces sp. ITFR-21]WNI17537.1 hypothetical protein RLT57_19795 [Streptomyces sp. ITFR-21]